MNENELKKQVEITNKAFHRLWFSLLLGRPDLFSEKLKGLSFIDLNVISISYEKPGLILKEIREYLKIPQTTLSSIVTKLEKLGLVERVITRRDMHSYSIKITDKGKGVIDEHRRIDINQARKVIMTLEGQERYDFVALIEKVASRIE